VGGVIRVTRSSGLPRARVAPRPYRTSPPFEELADGGLDAGVGRPAPSIAAPGTRISPTTASTAPRPCRSGSRSTRASARARWSSSPARAPALVHPPFVREGDPSGRSWNGRTSSSG